MANPSESQSATLLNPNQRQAAKWKYEIISHCSKALAERLCEERPREGWELVSVNSYVDPRGSARDMTMGDGTLDLAYTLVFRRDETRMLDIVGEENVHPLKPPSEPA